MKRRDVNRILTTHAGSLPRPIDLLEMVRTKARGDAVDERAFAARLKSAVADIVRKQADLGIDIVDDGEFSKPSFVTYARDRLSGIEPTGAARQSPWLGSREALAFPEFYQAQMAAAVAARQPAMASTGPIAYKGQQLLKTDLDNLKAALARVEVSGAFVPSISPSNIEEWFKNRYYNTSEEYLLAIAEAMREEYRAIVDARFILQIDDPRLVSYYMLNPNLSVEQCRNWAELRVEALNHALRDIPAEKIRYHTCYGINMGPRVHDMEVKDLIDVIVKIRAGAFSFEAANPRHEHEWQIWTRAKLPEGTTLIPGVISHSTVLVEHPELVAERIVRYANVVGRDHVIAGSDCGFATFAGADEVHPSIVWAKFEALTKGAELASKRLWGNA